MKTFVVFVFGIFVIFNALAQEAVDNSTQSGPVMAFTEDSHDFGDIHQGDKVQYTFKFENSGNEPLIISNVQVTCGCTASDWPRDPILPGQESELTIIFNSAGKMGRQNKVATIISNAVGSNKVTIVTNVLPKKDDSKD